MNFKLTIDEVPGTLHFNHVIYREAVRAILLKEQLLLVIQTNKGDYKLPGGGLKSHEEHESALLREIQEETGYLHCSVLKKVGIVIETKKDSFADNSLFKMTSHYYSCTLINEQQVAQQLDPYELEQQFKVQWISIDAAITENERLLQLPEQNDWLARETLVLKEIKRLL